MGQIEPFLSEVAARDVIPQSTLAYFRERLRRRIYNYIVRKFLEQEKSGIITRAELARRLQRDPSQITKWLGTPGNLTFDTISDLLLAISAEELEISGVSVLQDARPPQAVPPPPMWKDAEDKAL